MGATISNAGQFEDHVPILWPHGDQRIETHVEERCNAGGRLGHLIAEALEVSSPVSLLSPQAIP